MKGMTERVLGPLIAGRFDAFGCSKRGAHTDDLEREGCLACAVERGTVDNPDHVYALVDDRGSVSHLDSGPHAPWPHTRYYKPRVGLHRLDGPAIDSEDLRAYFVDGLCHRVDGPAIEWGEGWFAWFNQGRLHRVGGPAVSIDLVTEWRRDGRLHRDDGPSRITIPYWARLAAPQTEQRYEFALDGVLLSREDAWAHWVAGHTPIPLTASLAIEFLDTTRNEGSPPGTAFVPIDASAAEVALTLYPDCGIVDTQPPPVVLSSSPDPEKPPRVSGEPLDKFTSRITPETLLPPNTARQALTYDADAFRRRIDEAKRLGTLRPRLTDARWNWTDPRAHSGPLRIDDYVSADLEIDPDVVEFGIERMGLHRHFDTNQIETYKQGGGALPPTIARYWLASTAHAHAEQLALTYIAHGGFVEVAGRLTPSATIDCPIERAYEFAAQSIAAAVDGIVATSWATALVMAAGWPRIPLRWGGNTPLDEEYPRVVPAPSLASDYVAKALEDLRERGDATRFMDYVSRCYRWPSGAALTDG